MNLSLIGQISFLPEYQAPFYRSSIPEEQARATKREDKRIIVIDDEILIADSLAEILALEGYQSSAFYSGNAAIEHARNQCVDVVLSDVVMPEINGIDTVLAIRAACPDARVILFSGQAGSIDLLDRAYKAGHRFELLPKPIHPAELLKTLRSA